MTDTYSLSSLSIFSLSSNSNFNLSLALSLSSLHHSRSHVAEPLIEEEVESKWEGFGSLFSVSHFHCRSLT